MLSRDETDSSLKK